MAARSLIKEITRLVGSENALFSRRDLLAYSYDATQRQEMPEAIVFPHSASQISAIMKLARRERIPVVPRGSGTGISGGTVPVKGGIVLELSRMNHILSLDTVNRRATVEPGVINLDLQDALAPLGFMYPPDPASQKSCTLGGNIGENAGGPLCFRYGVTTKYVCGMEVVLPDGEIVELGGAVEDTPGYDLRGLLIGSEGILGIATRLILQIVPLPEASKTMLAVFDRLEDAGQAVSDIVTAGIVPAALELMDKKMCWAIEQSVHAGYPVDAEGVLLIEVAGLTDDMDRQVMNITDICQRNKVRELRSARMSSERDALWKGRKGAFGSVARLYPPYLVNDGTVPRNKLVPALLRVQEIAEKYHVQIANVAHAGDGNLHPLILYDRNNPEETAAARKTGEEILDTCLSLGGTISGEHGIGIEKLAAMRRMFSPADLAIMRRVKQVFDPDNILNPGKLLPPETDQASSDKAASAPATGSGDLPALESRLAEIVGAENLLTDKQEILKYQADGCVPRAVVFPTTTEQVSQIVIAANQYQKALIPRGSGSNQQAGTCLAAGDIVLCLQHMQRIIDLDTGNSTVRVEAGIGNDVLQRELAKYKLCFPLTPVFSEASTIGGELAASASGPGRLMYGTARDLVLGLTAVTPTGDIIHPGGKTMKNVAGLDLCKMLVGSWGTLGVITEATLRLCPLPEVMRCLCLTFRNGESAFRFTARLLNSALSPGAIEMVDWVAGHNLKSEAIQPLREGEILLMMGVEGSREAVARHLKEIGDMAEVKAASRIVTLEGEAAQAAWNAYRRMRQSFSQTASYLVGKSAVPLKAMEDLFRAVKDIGSKNGVEIGIDAHCGNGILHIFVPGEKESTLDIAEEIRRASQHAGGYFMFESASSDLRKKAGTWQRTSASLLIQRLKTELDPFNILNPGRVVGD